MDAFIGTIMPVAFNFAPANWALCQGQLISVSQNQALFALLGTQYGGDGFQTFGLPDLRSRVPVGQGQGPSYTNRVMGDKGGVESVTMSIANLPSHTHTLSGAPTVTGGGGVQASPKAGTTTDPTGNYMANAEIPAQGTIPVLKANSYVPLSQAGTLATMAGPATPVAVSLSSVTITATGNASLPALQTMPPFICVNYIICLYGIFPSRS